MGTDSKQALASAGDPPAWLWRYILAATILVAIVTNARAVEILVRGLGDGFYVGDFVVFWAAAKAPLATLYDFAEITRQQLPVTGDRGLRPFIYPPSSLLWMRPFGSMDLAWSFACWTAIGLGLFLAAAWKVMGLRRTAFLLASPILLNSVLTGQTSPLVGALILGGVALPNRYAAGCLFGLAAAIKPQSVLLLPIALAASKDWKAFLSTAIMGLAAVAASVLAFGLDLWFEWIGVLEPFRELILNTNLHSEGPTPTAFARLLGLPEFLGLLGIPFGIALVWKIFRTAQDPVVRSGALVAGCLLTTPYAMSYELVPLQLAASALLLDRRAGVMSWIGAASVFTNVLPAVGLVLISVAFLSRAAGRAPEGAPAMPVRERCAPGP